MRACKPGGPAADDGDFFIAQFFRLLDFDVEALVHLAVGGVALEGAYCDRVVHLAPVARILAGVRADASADGREGEPLAYLLERFGRFSVRNKPDITPDIYMDGAGRLAYRHVFLHDVVRRGFLAEPVHRSAPGKLLVVGVPQAYRACLETRPAVVALLRLDAFRDSVELELELPIDSLRSSQRGQWYDPDCRVFAGLFELRRCVSIALELLVLHHARAGGTRCSIYENNILAGIRLLQRCLHTGRTCPEHDDSLVALCLFLRKRLRLDLLSWLGLRRGRQGFVDGAPVFDFLYPDLAFLAHCGDIAHDKRRVYAKPGGQLLDRARLLFEQAADFPRVNLFLYDAAQRPVHLVAREDFAVLVAVRREFRVLAYDPSQLLSASSLDCGIKLTIERIRIEFFGRAERTELAD